MSDVRKFVERVNLALCSLRVDDIKDKELMYTWLWEKFKNWPPISTKTEQIRDSPVGSKKRSWNYLWTVINNHLTNQYEDINYRDISIGLTGTYASAQAQQNQRPRSSKHPSVAPFVVFG